MHFGSGAGILGVTAAALLALAVPGCKGHAHPTGDPQERLNVISNPSMYLDTGGFTFDDEAKDHEQLLGMTVWNKSAFTVRGLEGDIFWLDDDGKRIGSSRFALTGSVPAHGSQTFSIPEGTMTSGSLRGGALRVSIAFTHVNVAD
jgi:hypothetical protein